MYIHMYMFCAMHVLECMVVCVDVCMCVCLCVYVYVCVCVCVYQRRS